MVFFRTCGVFFLLLALTGCSGVAFSHSSDPSFDSAKIKSFSIAQESRQAQSARAKSRLVQKNPLFVQKLSSAINTELSTTLGWQRAAETNSDVQVVFDTQVTFLPGVSQEELRFESGTSGSRFPRANPRLRSLRETTLRIKLIEPLSQQVLWEGRADHLLPEFYESAEGVKRVLRQLLAPLAP